MKKNVLLIGLSFILSVPILFSQNPVAIPDTLSGAVINLTLQTGSMNFRPGPATSTMGANGNLLGPTLVLQKNQQVTINVNNQLGEPTTIHWHGMHVAPENDGGPHIVIMPGSTWSPSFTVMDNASTHWYHPHLHHHTNEHVLKGIAGFIITRDAEEAALNLPRKYGVDDFPLVVQTKALDANNQIVVLSALDSVLMVNGTRNPYLDAPAQVVRLRLLNGSSERYYNFGFTSNKTFHMIASDAGLLDAPVAMTRLQLAPGERAEILIDLAPFNGQSFHLVNFGSELPNAIYGATQPGMGPGQTIPNYTQNQLNGANFNVMQINVVSATANPVTSIPAALITNMPYPENTAVLTRNFTFNTTVQGPTAIQGPFQINQTSFDMNVINFETLLDNVEIWELRNQTPISHPFHLHGFPFYVLSINGNPPPAHLRGKKDVVHVPAGNGVVRFITKFDDFANDSLPYMYHCHMLTHEDDGMMGQFLVKNPCELLFDVLPENAEGVLGSTVQFVAEANDAGAGYQWQTDLGVGFQNLTNSGQYSGVNTNILTISNVALINNNQQFRCIINSQTCSLTSSPVVLTVIDDSGLSNEELGAKIRVYPNPTEGILHLITNPSWNGSGYYVSDPIGKIIQQGTIAAENTFINLTHLPAGMYFLKVGDVNPQTFSIVKK